MKLANMTMRGERGAGWRGSGHLGRVLGQRKRQGSKMRGNIKGATITLIRREGPKSSFESLDIGCVQKYLLILLLFCGVLTSRTPSWVKTLVTSEKKWRRHESKIGEKVRSISFIVSEVHVGKNKI